MPSPLLVFMLQTCVMMRLATRPPALLAALLLLLTFATGCRAIEGIFKIGFWAGVIVAAIFVAIVVALIKGLSR